MFYTNEKSIIIEEPTKLKSNQKEEIEISKNWK